MLQLRNISYRIGQLPLLNNVSMNVTNGSITVIIGANGAGKSTLLKVACGMLQPASGTVFIQGKMMQEWNQQCLAQFMAVLHQQTLLTLPFTVTDVVMMGRYPHFKNKPASLDQTIVHNAMVKAGIAQLAERNYLELSGGEQQRVHLARVFAQIWFASQYETRYLFMDEPSNNLDIRHQHTMLEMAREFAKEGNCVLTVLHDLNLAMQYADNIILLKKGRIIASGPVHEVMKEGPVSNAYDFPINIINHAAYDFPIVMPAVNSTSINQKTSAV